jgi:hypothetical protein
MELEKVLVIDPVTNVEETYKTKEVVYKSNVNKSLYKYVADSQSDTNIIFNNITPPSLNTILPRSFKILNTMDVAVDSGADNTNPAVFVNAVNTTTGASTAGNANFNLVLADSPLQTSCIAIELRINGSSTSITPNDFIMVYSHLVDNQDLNGELSTLPHQKDTMPIYNGWASDKGNYYNNSVFAPFQANVAYPSNQSQVWVQNANSGTGGRVYNYTVSWQEELYLSPAVWGRIQEAIAGFSNINNLTLNFRISNLNRSVRVQSDDVGAYIANVATINCTFGTGTGLHKSELELTYITPDPVLSAKMPNVLAMDYSYIQTFISSSSKTLAYNARQTQTVIFQSIRLPSIPKRMMVYAKPAKSLFSTTAYLNTIPDIFLPISQLQVTFNNRINLFANDTAQTLYQKSVANGLKDTFIDWQYNTGSIMIIDIAKDIGLEADECSGQSNKYSTLQIQATFSNSNLLYWGLAQNHPLYNLANWDFYVLVESPGKAFVTPSDCQFVLTGPSSAEVLALTSSMDKVVDESDLDGKQVGGGAFGLGKLFKSGLRMLKNVNPDQVASGVKAVQNAMGAMGLGVAGGAMKHRRVY